MQRGFDKPVEEPLEGGDGTVNDLKQALVENLEHRGVLGKLRAKVRAEIFHTLQGPQEGVLPPTLSNDNLLINELVRDYLSYNGYQSALSVFMAESGQPSDRALDRAFVMEELGLTEQREAAWDGRAPLLYGITDALKRWKEGSSQPSSSQERAGEEEEGDGWRIGPGPPRVPVSREDGFLPAESTAPAKPTTAEEHHGIGGSHPGIGRGDPPPLSFIKRSGRADL